MNTETVEDLLPDLVAEQPSDVPQDTPSPLIEEVSPLTEPISIPEEAPVTPPPASDVLLGIKVDGEPFLDWALESSVSFLNLADLPAIQTVDGLRGLKESQIRDKVQMANSLLVLIANYGSETDNEPLVAACELYAAKMKTIIKRLCL